VPCVCDCVVESYTREAGVRTLERRIGALCRAVAVKVAEHADRLDSSTADSSNKDDPVKSAAEQELDTLESVDKTNISTVPLPPRLPIVLDVAAVEDILGVG